MYNDLREIVLVRGVETGVGLREAEREASRRSEVRLKKQIKEQFNGLQDRG